jgi:hypothetical protein
MGSPNVVDSFVSEHNTHLVEHFLFTQEIVNPRQALLEALESCFAVLVGQSYLADSASTESTLVDVAIEKMESMTDTNSMKFRLDLLKTYWTHFQTTPRGSISAPVLAPWRLLSVQSATLLRLSNYMRLNSTSNDSNQYFHCVTEARKIAQRLAMKSEAQLHSRWLEGLSYVWQALGGSNKVDVKIRDQVLKHVRRLLIYYYL